jgi:hypothetical protein
VRTSLEQSLASDEARLAKLQAQIAAKKARLVKVNRAMDTRRKIMIGAWVLDCLEQKPEDPLWSTLKANFADFKRFLGEKNEGLFPDFFSQPAVPAARKAAD